MGPLAGVGDRGCRLRHHLELGLQQVARIQALVDARNAARKSRDFARADTIRDQLAGEGILLEDTAAGVRWRRA